VLYIFDIFYLILCHYVCLQRNWECQSFAQRHSNFNSTLPDWEIKLSTTKPVSSVFHLHYKEPSVSLRYTSMVNHCQFDPTSNPLD